MAWQENLAKTTKNSRNLQHITLIKMKKLTQTHKHI